MELWDDQRLTAADADLIKMMARKFARKNDLPRGDDEDLRQDLAVHVLAVSHRFQSERGPRKRFLSKVIKNKLLKMDEASRAQKRDRRQDVSLEAAGGDALLDGKVQAGQMDTVIDVRDALASLPEDLQQIARLRAEHSERDLESLLGLSREQVRGRIRKIEKHFRKIDPNSLEP